MTLNYDPKKTFRRFLNQTIKQHHINIKEIAPQFGRDGKNFNDWCRYDNHKPNREHLIQLAELINVPFKQLYWYRMTIYNRQHANPKASLQLVADLTVNWYLSNLTTDQMVATLKTNFTEFNKWMQLKQPIPTVVIKRFAHMFNLEIADLQHQNISLAEDPDFDGPLYQPKPKSFKPSIKAATLATHLQQIVKIHPVYHQLSKLIKISGIYNSALYQVEPITLKYARQIATYMNVDLQTLLFNPQTNGHNQLYANVMQYCKDHHLTKTQFENNAKLPTLINQRLNDRNKYLNALVILARVIPTTIDELVTPTFEVPKIGVQPANLTNYQSNSKKTRPRHETNTEPCLNQEDQKWLKAIHQLDPAHRTLLKQILTAWRDQ